MAVEKPRGLAVKMFCYYFDDTPPVRGRGVEIFRLNYFFDCGQMLGCSCHTFLASTCRTIIFAESFDCGLGEARVCSIRLVIFSPSPSYSRGHEPTVVELLAAFTEDASSFSGSI